MSTISINGKLYHGDNVVMRNGRLFIDGVEQDATVTGRVTVAVISGPLLHLEVDGSVECGDVLGSVQAGGSVECGAVGGSVQAGGSVDCGPIHGPVSAGGSIRTVDKPVLIP